MGWSGDFSGALSALRQSVQCFRGCCQNCGTEIAGCLGVTHGKTVEGPSGSQFLPIYATNADTATADPGDDPRVADGKGVGVLSRLVGQ